MDSHVSPQVCTKVAKKKKTFQGRHILYSVANDSRWLAGWVAKRWRTFVYLRANLISTKVSTSQRSARKGLASRPYFLICVYLRVRFTRALNIYNLTDTLICYEFWSDHPRHVTETFLANRKLCTSFHIARWLRPQYECQSDPSCPGRSDTMIVTFFAANA